MCCGQEFPLPSQCVVDAPPMRGTVASITARCAAPLGGGDSGVGSLALLAALSSALPIESGDTAGA